MLKRDFVVGVRDITGEPWAGDSGHHKMNGVASTTSNGSGPHNIQMFVLAPDGTVIDCLPGYWCAQDLAFELKFAMQLYLLYEDPTLSIYQKRVMCSQMQLAHIRLHSLAMRTRSHMQSFDAQYELTRHNEDGTLKPSFSLVGLGEPTVKGTDEIMHERMAMQPFVPYQYFDVARFCDYGQQYYDKDENWITTKVMAKAESSVFHLFGHKSKQSEVSACAGRPEASSQAAMPSESSAPESTQ